MNFNNLITWGAFLLSISTVEAKVNCPARYPNGSPMTFQDGTIRFVNGNMFRLTDGTLRYPNGNTLRFADGTLRYPNGNTLRFADGTFRYENGNILRFKDGTLRESDGTVATKGSIYLTSQFGEDTLRIGLSDKSVTMQTLLPYGEKEFITLDMTEDGDVNCTVEAGSEETQLRVEGPLGTAAVTIKAGKDVQAIRKAIELALGVRIQESGK